MTENKNPFLKPYNTPHDTAPFHLIKIEHYEPALLEGMKEQNEEIDAIVNNPETPTFQNTIVALEKSGALLDRVTTVFGNLMSAETSDEMQELAEKMMPVLSEHSNNISLNEKLFARIKAVYEQKDQLQLKGEDAQLLQKTYDGFVRSGANLTGEAKEKFGPLNTELSILTLRFSQNLLKETNNYELALTEKQLEGLPESSLESYAQTAKDKGKEGSIITLDAPSFVPFMKYCDDRSLRREVIYRFGKRTYEYLKLYLIPETDNNARRQNQATMNAANAIKSKRIIELTNGEAGIETKERVYLLDWMNTYKENQAKRGKKDGYQIDITIRILKDYAGERMLMDQIDKTFCQNYLDYLQSEYRSRGKRVSNYTLHTYYRVLNGALNAAVRAEIIKSNPFTKISKSEKIRLPESKRSYMTIEEVRALIATPMKNESVKGAYLARKS